MLMMVEEDCLISHFDTIIINLFRSNERTLYKIHKSMEGIELHCTAVYWTAIRKQEPERPWSSKDRISHDVNVPSTTTWSTRARSNYR